MTRAWSLRNIIIVLLAAGAIYALARTRRDFWDFEVYRTAATRAMAAEPLYRPEDGHYQFKYWPAFAFMAAPFGLLPPEPGKVLWCTLSLAALASVMRLSIQLLPRRSVSPGALGGWTFLVTAKFIVKELVNGQTNLLLAALALMSLRSGERRKPLKAGVLIGLAIFIKPYALLLVPWAAVTFGPVAVLGAGGVVVAGLLLPALNYGWAGNLELLSGWYATVTQTTTPNLFFPENISYQSMWAKWIGAGDVAAILTVATAAVALLVFVGVWLLRRGVPVSPGYLELSALLLLMPLISPQGWDYVLLLAMPGYVLLIDRFRASPLFFRITVVTGILLTSFTVFDLLGRALYGRLMAASVVTVGATLLFICLARLRWRAEA